MSERYYHQIGSGAYQRLGELFGHKQPGGALAQIFKELSHQFGLLSQALKRVAGVPERDQELEVMLARLSREQPAEPGVVVPSPRGLFDMD